MRPHLFLLMSCVLWFAGAAFLPGAVASDALVDRVRNAALSIQRKSWEQGVLAVAFMEEGREDLVVQMAKASLIFRSKEGVPAALGGAPVDPLMLGEALVWAAEKSGDPELKKAVAAATEYVLKTAPRAADGTIFHTGETIWSDSYHTAPPFLAFIGMYDEALEQIEGHRKRLWNSQSKLIAHIWDEKEGKFRDTKFWGGGCGWAAAGMTRIIRRLSSERSAERQKLISELEELIDGCLAHQTESGLFYDVVDDASTFEETNLAQMLAYSIYEGVRGGWLKRDYLAAADRMRAAARAKVDAAGFVQGVSGAPEFKRPGISAEGQAFFLMMEAAAQKVYRK
ncbi:MAG: glycoside hydrolase family 88 protein [Nibricoccus sp.]